MGGTGDKRSGAMLVTRYECAECGRLLKSPRGLIQHAKMKHDLVLALEDAERCDVEENLNEIKRPKKPLHVRLGFIKKPRKGMLLIGIGLALVVCPLWIVAGLEREDEAEASAQWPSVEGVIVESRLESRRRQDSTLSYDVPIIVYEYTVDGVQYEGDRITFLSVSSTQEAPEMAEQYPVGTRVNVYYDPSDPNEAILLPGRQRESGFGKLGIVIGLFGLALIFGAFRKGDD